MYNPKAHLKRLVEIHAPSGDKQPVANALREYRERLDLGETGLRFALMVDLSQS